MGLSLLLSGDFTTLDLHCLNQHSRSLLESYVQFWALHLKEGVDKLEGVHREQEKSLEVWET